LREYLRNRAVDTLVAMLMEEGVEVSPSNIHTGVSGDVELYAPAFDETTFYVYLDDPSITISAFNDWGRFDTLMQVTKEAANRTGRLVSVDLLTIPYTSATMRERGFRVARRHYPEMVTVAYAPDYASNRGGIAASYLQRLTVHAPSLPVEAAMHAFAIPEEYRKQVEEMFRSAFEHDDLAAYEHAQHLAELISE
jgi:hypothetical protein